MARRAEPGKSAKPAARPPRPERLAAFRLGLLLPRAAPPCCSSPKAIASWRGAGKRPVGEIDIVARRRRDLVFVEVKARSDLDAAAEAVAEHGRRRIIAAAEFWLASHPADAESFIRVDVILVAPGKMPRHVANAFDATR